MVLISKYVICPVPAPTHGRLKKPAGHRSAGKGPHIAVLLLKISESQGAGELPCAFPNSLGSPAPTSPQSPKLSGSPEGGAALHGPPIHARGSWLPDGQPVATGELSALASLRGRGAGELGLGDPGLLTQEQPEAALREAAQGRGHDAC